MWNPSVNAIWLRAASSSEAIGRTLLSVGPSPSGGARSTLDRSPWITWFPRSPIRVVIQSMRSLSRLPSPPR